jgi:hypothetical protein
LCEPHAKQFEATEVRTQYIDVALFELLSRRAQARHFPTPYPCILAESTAVTMFGRNLNLLALFYFSLYLNLYIQQIVQILSTESKKVEGMSDHLYFWFLTGFADLCRDLLILVAFQNFESQLHKSAHEVYKPKTTQFMALSMKSL